MTWVEELMAAEDTRWDQLQADVALSPDGYLRYCLAVDEHLANYAL